jgi:hypothetical protein
MARTPEWRSPDLILAKDMAKLYDDPLGFVLYAYPWDTDESIQVVELQPPWNMIYNSRYGPDAWACEVLDEVGQMVRERRFNGRDPVAPLLSAITSGHGIGKSALVAWIVDWIMSTRPYARGTVTAVTAPQLSSKTWAEIAKWTAKCVTRHWFNVTTGRGSMRMEHKQHPEAWFCTAQTCREEDSEAFAGQHAANSTSFYIFDEASGIPDKIFEVSQGGLTDGEPMMFAFGNPTQNTGWFADVFRKLRHRWRTRAIDSRDVAITNKPYLDQLIADHGLDSDLVKVRVRGMFPAASSKQFISSYDVDAAYGKELKADKYAFAPKILTCDPAWEGDDELVIALRQGLVFRILRTIAKNDNDMHVATLLAQYEDEHKADAVFVDAGYGTGIVSAGRTMKRDWTLVWFSGESTNPGCLNKRAQMWQDMKQWLKDGGAIPKDQQLYDDLIGPWTVPRPDGKIQLESKQDMKKRSLASPNKADALALSFAFPVQSKDALVTPTRRRAGGYDPIQHGKDQRETA